MQILKPAHVGDAVIPAAKVKEKQFSLSGEKILDPELVQRSRIALLGLKRSLICSAIVLLVLITVYFILR